MPTSAEILRLLDPTPTSQDVLRGGQPAWSMLDKVYGGQLFGQAVAAASTTVDPDRQVHSVQAFCLDTGRHGIPIDYRVERVRDGRSFTHRAVHATQEGRPLLRMMASYQVEEPGLVHQPPMPDVPRPEDMPSLQDVIRDHSELEDGPWRREWEGLEIRYDPGLIDIAAPGEPARQRIWIKVAETVPDDARLHRHLLVYLSDLCLLNASLVPHGIVMGAFDLPRATLNHSVWLHAPVRADEWLLVEQRSLRADGARALVHAEVYDTAGTHVASYAQEGLIRPRGVLREHYGLS